MRLIVGLGNPGEKYVKTRHNSGFMTAEHFLKDFEAEKDTSWTDDKKLKSDITKIEWKPKVGSIQSVILAKPKTYMNNSGMAVDLLRNFYKISPADIWIIHDDVDLPLGTLKIRFGGAAGGHHGVESIIKSLGTDSFWRFRLGIGRQKRVSEDQGYQILNIKGIDDFVLGNFTSTEMSRMRELIERTSRALAFSIENDLHAAMNKFNTK